jgi:hypothetical protein
MNSIRQNIKTLLQLKKAIGRPPINGWLGRKAFNRTKGRKFGDLAILLDDDEFRSFCSAIGWVEVNWALMEQNFDRWIQVIFRKLNGASIESEPPKAFKKKAAFLRKAFNTIPRLSTYKDEALVILSRATKLSTTRNDLTHAVITSMKPVNGKYELENFKLHMDATHTIKDVIFDVRDFPALSLELARLGSDSLHISARLLDEF